MRRLLPRGLRARLCVAFTLTAAVVALGGSLLFVHVRARRARVTTWTTPWKRGPRRSPACWTAPPRRGCRIRCSTPAPARLRRADRRDLRRRAPAGRRGAHGDRCARSAADAARRAAARCRTGAWCAPPSTVGDQPYRVAALGVEAQRRGLARARRNVPALHRRGAARPAQCALRGRPAAGAAGRGRRLGAGRSGASSGRTHAPRRRRPRRHRR